MIFNNKNFFLLFLASVTSYFTTYSQEQNDQWINTKNGLPTNHIYASQKENNDYLWFATDKGILKFNGSSFKKISKKDGLPTDDVFGIYIDLKNRKWLDHVYQGLYYIENDSVKKVNEFSNKNNFRFIKEQNDSIFFTRAYSNELFVFVKNRLHFLSYTRTNDFLTKKQKNRLNNLQKYAGDTKNFLEGRFFGNNLYYITKNNKLYKRKLQSLTRHITNIRFTNLKKSYKFNNHILFVSPEDSLFRYNLQSKKIDFINKYSSNLKYSSFKYNDRTLIIVYNQTIEFLNSYTLKKEKKKTKLPTYVRAVFTVGDSSFYIYNFHLFKNGRFVKKFDIDLRLNLLFAKNKDIVLLGNETTLLKYSLNTKTTIKKDIKNSLSIAYLNDEYIIGTDDKIIFLDENLLIQRELKTDKKVTNIVTYKSYFICSLENEIVIFKKEKKRIKHIYTFNENDNLLDDFITNLQIDNNSLFVFFANGFTEINLNEVIKKKLIAGIEIERFYNNNKSLDFSKKLNFNRTGNNLEIVCSIKTINNPANFTKVYSLSRNNEKSEWIRFNDHSLNFDELSYGNYILKLGIKKKFEKNILNEKVLNFTITPYIFETGWFIYVVIFLSIILSVIGTLLYRKREQKKMKFSNALIHSEVKALKAQMNPHFIFNSLNSIQSSFFLKDSVNSNKIFVNFSKLLRTTLEMINQKEITLKEELRYIDNYIRVIKTNHKKEIEVEFNTDTSLDLFKIIIPTLLLQPIVENSIEHGLLPSPKEKKITIRVFPIENTKIVQVEIEDNGVGRNFIKSNKKHTSLGVNLINERIHLLNKLSKSQKLELIIVDLKNNSLPRGTKVVLKITNI